MMIDAAAWMRMPYVIAESALYDKCFAARIIAVPYCLAASFLCVPMPIFVDVEYSWIRYIEAVLLSLWVLYYFYRPIVLFFLPVRMFGWKDDV
jgi:hypothetical protein